MGWRGPAAIRSSRSLLGERGRGEAATYGPARRRVPGESVTWQWGRADAAGSEAHLETVDALGGH